MNIFPKQNLVLFIVVVSVESLKCLKGNCKQSKNNNFSKYIHNNVNYTKKNFTHT